MKPVPFSAILTSSRFTWRIMFLLPIILAVSFVISTPNRSHAVDAAELAENIDNYFLPAYPDVYGSILEKYTDSDIKSFNPEKMGRVLEYFGYFQTVDTMLTKMVEGDNTSAALAVASAVVKKGIALSVDETVKKVVIYGYEAGALPLTLLVTTLEITKASYDAVEASKTALDLERLYYKIEADPTLKTQGRKLGEGEPIRQDQQAVEHFWRMIYSDKDFEGIFKNYVTSVLGQEWPEPTFWETLTTSSGLLREAKLLEEQQRIKTYIKGLLSELNSAAKKREAGVILAKQMKEIAASWPNISEGALMIKAMEYGQYALLKLPEAKAYLASFPSRYAEMKTRFDKATPTELTVIKKLIIGEQVNITLFAAALRGFPTRGKYAGERMATLTELKGAYVKLNSLYDAIPQSEINRRLEAENKRIIDEAARLDTGGVSFEFTRHQCTKSFDDVKSGFFDKVMSGAGDALQAVDKSKALISKDISEIKNSYDKDFLENEKKSQDAATKLGEQTGRVQQAYDAMIRSGKGDSSSLYYQLQNLKHQAHDLGERFEKYHQIFATSSDIDFTDCGNTLTEIDKFYEANNNKFGITQALLNEQFVSAQTIYYKFLQTHGTNIYLSTNHFLPPEELVRLKKTVADAPDSYIGMDLKFLKSLIHISKERTISLGVLDIMKDILAALGKYRNATSAMRMQHYPSYETSTLPCLKFMESKDAASAIQTVLNAIDSAIIAYQETDPRTVSQTAKQEFDTTLSYLRWFRKDMEEYQKLIGQASGLSALFEGYLIKALKQNASLEDDMAYLSSILQRFETARWNVESTFVMSQFKAGSWSFALGTTPPAVTRESVMSALDKSDILGLSEQLGLGLAPLIPADFIEVKAKEGFITITVDDVNRLTAKIQALPTTNLQAFIGPLYAMRQSTGAEGFIVECFYSVGNNLWPLFSSSKGMEAAGQKLREALSKQRDLAEKSQSVIDNANARFGLVLEKANSAITAIKQYIAQGQSNNALIYVTLRDDLVTQYSSYNETRADVDAALKELSGLIEQAQAKMIGEGAPGAGQVPAAVQDFYRQFRAAYESRNDSLIMSFMGDEWETEDGTTLSDLQANLRRSFKIFDEIRFSIQNLAIVPNPDRKYIATYDVTISSRIYSRNLKHEEKSSVTEVLSLDASGKVKIVRTIGGRFWLIQ